LLQLNSNLHNLKKVIQIKKSFVVKSMLKNGLIIQQSMDWAICFLMGLQASTSMILPKLSWIKMEITSNTLKRSKEIELTLLIAISLVTIQLKESFRRKLLFYNISVIISTLRWKSKSRKIKFLKMVSAVMSRSGWKHDMQSCSDLATK
jgi:hypothetical protein